MIKLGETDELKLCMHAKRTHEEKFICYKATVARVKNLLRA